MGKRSHNSYTYYQCDLTAFPMQRPGSQMPVWKTGEDGKEKLSKVGSYLNNECVMARAEQMASKSEITQETLDRVREYLEARTGVDMRLSAEALEELDPKVLTHFGGTYTMGLYKQRCEAMTRVQLVTAILVPVDKASPIKEILVDTTGECVESICDHIGRSKATLPHDEDLRISQMDDRPRMSRERKYELYHAKNYSALKNARATQLLRSDVFGNALILQHTTEPGRLTKRYCSYKLAEYENVFARKKRASAPASDTEPVALTDAEFKKLKVGMQETAASAEAQLSSTAVPPQSLARSKPLPQKTGAQLAKEYPPVDPSAGASGGNAAKQRKLPKSFR